MRLAAGVEYCGAGFYGWQKQPGQRTVQESLETAISRVASHPVTLQCAGRTDAGVHAVQQVVHFDTASERTTDSWLMGTNSNLSRDIRLIWVSPVEQEFHARFSAIARRYVYLIINRPVRTAIYHHLLTWEYRRLDETAMAAAARQLIGEHDFSSYRATSCQAKTAVRNITRLDVNRIGEMIRIDITANAFLHHMVRNIVGVLMKIGTGKEQPGWAKEVLEARDRTLGGVTAPADGLYLLNVYYPEKYRIPVQGENPESLIFEV